MTRIVVFKNASWIFCDISWEYENDEDYLCTINLKDK